MSAVRTKEHAFEIVAHCLTFTDKKEPGDSKGTKFFDNKCQFNFLLVRSNHIVFRILGIVQFSLRDLHPCND